jgi:adenylate kinase family enzyme
MARIGLCVFQDQLVSSNTFRAESRPLSSIWWWINRARHGILLSSNEASMNRILVIGNAGAGKSNFARRLGGTLRLPVIHLDSHFWRTGWQMPETSAWRQQLIALVASPVWMMDGNYINTFDIRMPCADSLVWLDHRRGICIRRVLIRTIMGHGRTRSDLAEGCPDRFDIAFLRYVWTFPVSNGRAS